MNYIENGDSLNSTDSLTLAGLAQLCPSTQGAIAYNASALYRGAFGAILDCNCLEGGSKQVIDNGKWGTQNLQKSNLHVFPNPARSVIKIRSKIEDDLFDISIYDLMGRLMIQKTLASVNGLGEFEIDLLNGVYLISVLNKEGNACYKKLVISK